ncbi:Dynein heavy chain family protein [Reticulomyxa filosa]|uniref:Dynein heavy chain family protein n=1 Tax=Reticulomyxa filosa TaxID=46433 RepID=X6N9L8_RETFI|nr:Dynein heavy chain family protein [Reticulomyxa filosa]|eukprot:ETO22424.1 Dynein heavy chain family protein [Reticulomyxa filosa]
MFLNEQAEIPWESLRYVIGEINYGGRVTDDWDRRCLMTILGQYYNEDILDSEHYLLVPNSSYKIPDGKSKWSIFQNYVETLPYEDDPVMFGMNENANITFQSQESSSLIATLLHIRPQASNSNQKKQSANSGDSNKVNTPDEMVKGISKQILEQMPERLHTENLKMTMECEHNGQKQIIMDSLAIFLTQEANKFNRLLSIIQMSLTQLQKAINGEVVMSSELDGVFMDLLNNKVPAMWSSASYPSLKPLGSWIQDLNKRFDFIRNCLTSEIPKAYWISAFFFTQGFITGILQNHSRKYKIAIDQLQFKFTVLKANTISELSSHEAPLPRDGVYVYGLYLDGAKWSPSARSLDDANLGELHYVCLSFTTHIYFAFLNLFNV